MTLDDGVHAFRLRVIARAQALRNVSQACRKIGISRSPFYRNSGPSVRDVGRPIFCARLMTIRGG